MSCSGCNNPLTSKILNALGGKWHPECFKCSQCQQPISGGQFAIIDDSPVCVPCVEKDEPDVILVPPEEGDREEEDGEGEDEDRPLPPSRSPPPPRRPPPSVPAAALFGGPANADDEDEDVPGELPPPPPEEDNKQKLPLMKINSHGNAAEADKTEQGRDEDEEEEEDEDQSPSHTRGSNVDLWLEKAEPLGSNQRRKKNSIIMSSALNNQKMLAMQGAGRATLLEDIRRARGISTAVDGPDPAFEMILDKKGPAPPQRDDGQSVMKMYQLLKDFGGALSDFIKEDPYLEAHFPEQILASLHEVNKRVHEVEKYLEADLESLGLGGKSSVDALIEWSRMDWNFENEHVAQYRTHLMAKEYKQEFKEWTMPRYFDNTPLLPGSGFEICNIAMDSAIDSEMSMSVSESADEALKAALEHFKPAGQQSEFVLKAFGYREYMYGSTQLIDFQFIRQRIRAFKKRLLVLTKKPPAVEVLPSPDRMPVPAPFDGNDMAKLDEVDQPFEILISHVDDCSPDTLPLLDTTTSLYITCFLFHGTTQIPGSVRVTVPVTRSHKPSWTQKLKDRQRGGGLKLKDLPRETRIAFLLNGSRGGKESFTLAWATRQLIDENGLLLQGTQSIGLWSVDKDQEALLAEVASKRTAAIKQQYEYLEQHKKELAPKDEKKKKKKDNEGIVEDETLNMVPLQFIFEGTNRDNNAKWGRCARLSVSLRTFKTAVYAPMVFPFMTPDPKVVGPDSGEKELKLTGEGPMLEMLLKQDYLYYLTPQDKALIWRVRSSLVTNPAYLPFFLQSVEWHKSSCRNEAHTLLKKWKKPTPVIALALLHSRYADYTLRSWVVERMRTMTDSELTLYMLQLTQALKAEPYHRSPLSEFLLERAVASPLQFGHFFFWHLKAELSNPHFCERFSVMLEDYLTNCPTSAAELRKQNIVVSQLTKISQGVMTRAQSGMYDKDANKKIYIDDLEKLNKELFKRMPGGRVQLPLKPSSEVTSLLIDKCTIMSSKMAPLWLLFENADKDAPPVVLMFKSGDDLRQDILTLQMLRIMDRIWLKDGLDLQLTPYAVIACGVNSENKGVGMIEVVLNSDTTSGIQMKYGGGAGGAFGENVIRDFLKHYNPQPDLYQKAVDNFMRSCAGYVVATSVLGIGDRHNGNIMVTKAGHLFHIDFGHFLGNFKSKLGFKRERVAFVFTPDMAFVLGNENTPTYKKFQDMSCDSFLSLRKPENVSQLEMLFLLMVPAGMPELTTEQDLFYLKGRLRLDLTDKQARKWMAAEIKGSKDSKWRQLDNWFHNKKHG